MKKVILYIIISAVTLTSLQGQNFEWANGFGGNAIDIGYSIATDALGNVYTIGGFAETVDFDPGTGTFEITSNGSKDIFIQKLDADNNLIWAKSIGGVSYDVGYFINIDVFGNIIVTGRFKETVDFDPGTNVYELSSNGSSDIFILKLDTNGNFVWAKSMGGISLDRGYSIITDQSGNVFATGRFYDTVDFDPGLETFELISNGDGDIFILKLDANGSFVWAKNIGGSDYDRGYSIDIDTNGYIYTVGGFSSTVDFNPGSGTFELISNGNEDIFILKLSNDGDFIWAKSIGGIDYDCAREISIDIDDNIYFIGRFSDMVDFDPGSNTFNIASNGETDIFIQKLDNDGNFQWARGMGGIGIDHGVSITTDNLGYIYSAGDFIDTVDFDPGPETNLLTSNGESDIYINKFDANGNYIWANNVGGDATDMGLNLCIDTSKQIYITGFFAQTVDFDPGPETYNITANGSFDFFILKLIDTTVGLSDEIINNDLVLFPNPTTGSINISVKNETIKTVFLYSTTGINIIEMSTNEIDMTNLSNGIYFVKVLTESGKSSIGKVIKK